MVENVLIRNETGGFQKTDSEGQKFCGHRVTLRVGGDG
jgi:hypothetical protein